MAGPSKKKRRAKAIARQRALCRLCNKYKRRNEMRGPGLCQRCAR